MLRFVDVTKRFGGLAAVDGASFAAPAGAVTALVGPNGAGKTTLLTVAAGQMGPTAGRVELDGVRLSGRPAHVIARAGVARTFQRSRLVPELSVRDNVTVGALHSRGGRQGLRRRADQARTAAAGALDRLGLAGLGDEPVGQLSYGQQRMVELARALARRPRALLLDEPAAGLNPRETRALGELVRAVTAEHDLVTVLVEHDLGLVRGVSDGMVVLNFGQVIAAGAPDETCQDPAVVEAYIGEDGDAA